MSEPKRSRAKSEPTTTVFLRVPKAVKSEFLKQAKRAHRNQGGHFTALVEKGRGEAA